MISFVGEPEPPEFKTLNVEETLPAEKSEFPDAAGETFAPVRLSLDVSKAQIMILPDAEADRIKIDGEYDAANFELNTRVVEEDGVVTYRVSFKEKRFLSFFSDSPEGTNLLTLHLPRNIPIFLDLKLEMGAGELDLTGIPVAGIDGRLSMGSYSFRMAEANAIPAETMKLKMNMGELLVEDIQNFNFSDAEINLSMGEGKLLNSGALTGDIDLKMDVSMGQAFVQIPEGTRLEVREKSFWGDYEGPDSVQGPERAPLVNLQAKIHMGGLQVETATSKKRISRILLETVMREDVETALRQYRELRKYNEDEYTFRDYTLRTLGYKLIDMGRTQDALAIFKANIQEYPDQAKGYRALGYAYLKLGDRQRAIEYLKYALEIDPEYSSARRLLRRVEREERLWQEKKEL